LSSRFKAWLISVILALMLFTGAERDLSGKRNVVL
jgi:hypothetical protein